eukprot:CAMPEP_0197657862 /NCGR_PEP_ID=MMETSP1338-20131121/44885_1 /TAXON_ID=43686 ORGANISM="Pelagodinium beii, Strain RCC1491" /NCGR_SAMPLE_ID=MMETSP1338 /ASSEMBLY_ACC=CAM_ASM_000754 /LENGTH=876 /DNA_ID=CAMNT_0043234325 /DNA_START=44 /DNA_END=2674 /DNA_ORIENTATION=-
MGACQTKDPSVTEPSGPTLLRTRTQAAKVQSAAEKNPATGDVVATETSDEASHVEQAAVLRRGKSEGISESGDGVQEDLAAHKRPRGMRLETRELIRKSMRQDRLCACFIDADIDVVLGTMEYFYFEAGEAVVKQGEVGNTFFVVENGSLEVLVNGKTINTLASGDTFGGLALLYQCPRTATVSSLTETGCWGASGAHFQKVRQETARKQFSENRKFIDSVQLFIGLSEQQKDCVAQGVVSEICEKGSRLATEGEAANAMYFVKRGELAALDGAVRSIRSGECFGDEEVIGGKAFGATVVATSKSELLCVSAQHLRTVLATSELQERLEWALVRTALRHSPMLSQFSPVQQDAFWGAMDISFIPAQEPLPQSRIAVILEGSAATAQAASFCRGQWVEDPEDVLRAGPNGCRMAALTAQALMTALDEAPERQDLAKKMFLIRKVHVFRHLCHEHTIMLARSLLGHTYQQGALIVRQGEIGSMFFVIVQGEVQVTINGELIRTLGQNSCFGERALLFDEPRTASIKVLSQEAEVWAVDKAVFSKIVTCNMRQHLLERIRLQDTSVKLKDLQHVKVVGSGGSGVVRLVEHVSQGQKYALKRVEKTSGGRIPEEVERERSLLAESDHPFIMTYVKSFETAKYIYMLTEFVSGGELFDAIRTIPTALSSSQARFYTGSLLLVLEDLANRNIVYRDIKPENVMLDKHGYLKLIDFGIAKKLEGELRTFTVVGTPHYLAPEVLLGKGYGYLVDIWSLGVLQFELVCGHLPFAEHTDSPHEICRAVLHQSLKLPARYRHPAGRRLLQELIVRKPHERLGAGINGYEDLKNHTFFKEGHDDHCLFERIMSRSLEPPVHPCATRRSQEDICLDDADELASVQLSGR